VFKGESLLEMHNKLLFYIFRIDPYLGDKDGNLTWGATINHSRNNENLKPFVAGKNSDRPRVFLVAVHDIPETVEFLWNYNDTDWECHADSQTLPSEN